MLNDFLYSVKANVSMGAISVLDTRDRSATRRCHSWSAMRARTRWRSFILWSSFVGYYFSCWGDRFSALLTSLLAWCHTGKRDHRSGVLFIYDTAQLWVWPSGPM